MIPEAFAAGIPCVSTDVGSYRELIVSRPASGARRAWHFLHYFRRFPALARCGFCYSSGIRADRLLFWWFSSSRQQIVPGGQLRAFAQ